jgi:hypothetical protein
MASNSLKAAFRPFIFQLPAISGRMASVMGQIRLQLSGACASRAAAAVPEPPPGINTRQYLEITLLGEVAGTRRALYDIGIDR